MAASDIESIHNSILGSWKNTTLVWHFEAASLFNMKLHAPQNLVAKADRLLQSAWRSIFKFPA